MTKYCTQCGAEVAEATRFCNKCGAPLVPTQPAVTPSPGPRPGAAPTLNYQNPPNYQQPPGSGQAPYQPPAPYQQPGTPGAGTDLKPSIAGMLCYPMLFITGILFLVLAPYNKDRSIRFHAYQSIFFSAALMALNIILGVISFILPAFLDRLLANGLGLVAFGGVAWMMYQAYHGIRYKLPIIGELAESQAEKP